MDHYREYYKKVFENIINSNKLASEAKASTQCKREKLVLISLRKEQTIFLNKIAAALKRIESNTFGICKRCQSTISEDDLQSRPTSLYCSVCN